MQNKLSAGIASPLANTAQLEQLEAEAALLRAGAPLVPDNSFVGHCEGAHKPPILDAGPGVIVDGRVTEKVLHLLEVASEINEQRGAFVDEAASNRMRQGQ